MIKSCDDVETWDDYNEFANMLFNTNDMGLRETVKMLCWDDPNIISPKAFGTLSDYD